MKNEAAIKTLELIKSSIDMIRQESSKWINYYSVDKRDEGKLESIKRNLSDRELEHNYVIRALEEAIAQPVQPAVEPNAWRVTGTNRLYTQHDAEQEAKHCGGKTRAYAVYSEPFITQPVQPADLSARQCSSHLINLAAWLISPDATRSMDGLEENTHIGHRQFQRAHQKMCEVLRMKAIEIRKLADQLTAIAQPATQVQEPVATKLENPLFKGKAV